MAETSSGLGGLPAGTLRCFSVSHRLSPGKFVCFRVKCWYSVSKYLCSCVRKCWGKGCLKLASSPSLGTGLFTCLCCWRFSEVSIDGGLSGCYILWRWKWTFALDLTSKLPSLGISVLVDWGGFLKYVLRGAGVPFDDRQLIVLSFSLFCTKLGNC